MKKFAFIIIFFITGIIISGILGDGINLVLGCAGKYSEARAISQAHEYFAGGNYLQALDQYKKALEVIDPSEKQKLAQVKNNMAFCVFQTALENNDKKGMRESLPLFEESLSLYKEVGDTESVKQVETNISEVKRQAK